MVVPVRENFAEAFALVVGLEGKETNDPRDPGGHTKFGISKRAHPDVDIGALTVDQAEKIYLHNYWIPAKCDELPWPLDTLVFDSAVSQGPAAAENLLKKSATVKDLPERCALFMADRAMRYVGTRNFEIYGRGWFKRLFKICMDKSVSF